MRVASTSKNLPDRRPLCTGRSFRVAWKNESFWRMTFWDNIAVAPGVPFFLLWSKASSVGLGQRSVDEQRTPVPPASLFRFTDKNRWVHVILIPQVRNRMEQIWTDRCLDVLSAQLIEALLIEVRSLFLAWLQQIIAEIPTYYRELGFSSIFCHDSDMKKPKPGRFWCTKRELGEVRKTRKEHPLPMVSLTKWSWEKPQKEGSGNAKGEEPVKTFIPQFRVNVGSDVYP